MAKLLAQGEEISPYLTVASQEGRGSTFVFGSRNSPTGRNGKWGRAVRRRCETANVMTAQPDRLLVVDDDFKNRDMLSRRLIRRGYAVDVAEDGPSALERIGAAHYDLVLLDQMMPGMGGLDLLRLLRATYSANELPVIMVTAVDQAETVVEALNGGANDYVVNPVDLPVMTARIEAQLARAQVGSRNPREGGAIFAGFARF